MVGSGGRHRLIAGPSPPAEFRRQPPRQRMFHRNIIKTLGRENETQNFRGELLNHTGNPSYSLWIVTIS